MQASSSRSVSRRSFAKGSIAQHRLIDPRCPMCRRAGRVMRAEPLQHLEVASPGGVGA